MSNEWIGPAQPEPQKCPKCGGGLREAAVPASYGITVVSLKCCKCQIAAAGGDFTRQDAVQKAAQRLKNGVAAAQPLPQNVSVAMPCDPSQPVVQITDEMRDAGYEKARQEGDIVSADSYVRVGLSDGKVYLPQKEGPPIVGTMNLPDLWMEPTEFKGDRCRVPMFVPPREPATAKYAPEPTLDEVVTGLVLHYDLPHLISLRDKLNELIYDRQEKQL